MPALRLLLAASFVVLAALLLACGGGDGDEGASADLSRIPTATPPETLPEPLIVGDSVPDVRGRSYVIQSGDILSAIAEEFGTTVEAIMEANGIEDPTRLVVGERLVIPGAGGNEQDVLPATVEPPVEPEPPDGPPADGTYEVQSGDSASAIADRFGITVEELAAANDTTVDDLRTLSVGDVLLIPTVI